MRLKKEIKKILVLGAPLLAGLVSEFLMYLSDSAMVGRLSTDHLAAVAIAIVVAEILWIIVWPLLPATQAIASRQFGRAKDMKSKDTEKYTRRLRSIGTILNNALILGFIAGVAAMVAAIFCKVILGLLLEDAHLIPLVDNYISVLKWVMPVAGIFYALYGFLAAINKTVPIMVASIGLNLLNIGFNYILIFGKFGCPAFGIRGAAMGTVLAEILGTSYLLFYFLFSKEMKPYRCFRLQGIRKKTLAALANVAAPITGQLVTVFCIYLIYEILIANISAACIAATHIVFTLFMLMRAMVGGFAEGASILIGNNLGRDNKEKAVRYAFASEWISLLIGVFIFTVTLAFPEKIAAVFNNDPETIAMGAAALRFFAVFILIDIVGYCFETIFTHNGWGRFVFFSGASTHLILLLGLSFLFIHVFDLGIYAAWSAFAIQIICNTAILSAGFLSKKWLNISVPA